jgi:hypothetical protein
MGNIDWFQRPQPTPLAAGVARTVGVSNPIS